MSRLVIQAPNCLRKLLALPRERMDAAICHDFVNSLAQLFPDADYRHQLSIKRGDPAAYFAATPEHAGILAERERWLRESPALYAGALEGSESVVAAATAELTRWALIEARGAASDVASLGRQIEPDIVLLVKQPDGIFRVVAGCVCFPSSWAFAEKLGRPLDWIHAIVPGLNNSLGQPIARFLEKIQPGAAWERSNWGLSASPERNQHPTRKIPRLETPLDPEHVWLRMEDQILTILPETKALLFGIRIVSRSLAELRESEPQAAAGLRRALETLPDEMARYKNIAAVRSALVELLG
jgi:hypothetical protein